MPTSILVWNVQGFTYKKISTLNQPTMIGIVGKRARIFQMSQRRLRYILDNVRLKDPDIFVMIEVVSGQGKTGSLINSFGATGCRALLRQLRRLDPDWCLIPPLRMIDKIQIDYSKGYGQLVKERQYTEGVAVFYKKDKLDFQGPYVWPLADDPDDQDPDTVAIPEEDGYAGPYPPQWRNCLPQGPNFEAGQFEFFYQNGKKITFPSTEARNPFMVKLMELGGNNRTIYLACVHFPPQKPKGRTAFGRAASYFTNYPLESDELMLLVGDFNLPASDGDYRYLAIAGDDEDDRFTPVFNANTLPNSSMYYTNAWATPTSYMKPNKILDNILYRFGEDAKEVEVTGEIIDRVQSPNSLMMTKLASILALPSQADQVKVFRAYLNFGQLGPVPGTSDHLALYATF